MKRGFTIPEFLGVLAIIAIIGVVSFLNFQTSQVKARDENRKSAARSIVGALEKYHEDFGVFPPAETGKIVACGQRTHVSPCRWGLDKLMDLWNPEYPPYLETLPTDPHEAQGISFLYISNGVDFQIFASLEREKDPEWSDYVTSQELTCGKEVCNYGITLGGRPVERILEATGSAQTK